MGHRVKPALARRAFTFVKPVDPRAGKTAVFGDTGPSSNGFSLLLAER